jgi:hypothetical protein
VRLSFELSHSSDEQDRRDEEAEKNKYNPQEIHPDAQMYQKKWDHIVQSFEPVPTTTAPPETTTTPYIEETTEIPETTQQGDKQEENEAPPVQFKENDQQTRKDLAGNDVNLSPDAEGNNKANEDTKEEQKMDQVAAEADEM